MFLRSVWFQQRTRDLAYDVDLLSLQLRECIQLVAEIAYPIERFSTGFTCQDV
jgi:hypothetical protein